MKIKMKIKIKIKITITITITIKMTIKMKIKIQILHHISVYIFLYYFCIYFESQIFTFIRFCIFIFTFVLSTNSNLLVITNLYYIPFITFLIRLLSRN